jgi:hypothetical protein
MGVNSGPGFGDVGIRVDSWVTVSTRIFTCARDCDVQLGGDWKTAVRVDSDPVPVQAAVANAVDCPGKVRCVTCGYWAAVHGWVLV